MLSFVLDVSFSSRFEIDLTVLSPSRPFFDAQNKSVKDGTWVSPFHRRGAESKGGDLPKPSKLASG